MQSGTDSKNLDDWINWQYLEKAMIEKLHKQFGKAMPFPHLVMPGFFKEAQSIKVLQALVKEEFFPKEADLFKFMQTNDLAGTENDVLVALRSFIKSKQFVDYVRTLTGLKLKSGVVDMHGTLYADTDFLLCHDDQLEGRKIAFMYYLSTLGPKDGGSLNLLASKDGVPTGMVKNIVPHFNTLAIFEVSPVSFHEVEEVVAKKNRIAIGGWLHG